MADLPEIPDEATQAADAAAERSAPGGRYVIDAALAAAWPHLYAAALRHAAGKIEPTGWAEYLRDMADEATSR